MTDYNKVCWYCGSKDLKDMGDYKKCPKCGASYNDVPCRGYPTTQEESLEPAPAPFMRTLKIRRPSRSAVRAASRARKKAKVQ